ncbi:MAG: aminotransferase class III-fold pyridoxal phosphate-dependent enzyme [Polyangiaceae bacterium]
MSNRVEIGQQLPDIRESEAWHTKARRLIPAQCQTLAKGPTQYVDGVAPKYLVHGRGCRVWDVDGNEFIDLTMGVGPLVLGYGNEAVDRAVTDQLKQGVVFSLVHPLEVEVAEQLNRLVPGAECVRYSKTGADVTSAAVRLARAFTGRERVLCSGYHGWHDWYIGSTSRGRGVPQSQRLEVQAFQHGNIQQLEALLDEQVACVILEPVLFDAPNPDFLRQAKRAVEEAGALLIFDEMWTGFRVALGGAQERYDVKADLATFSKAVANGLPLSVLTGRRDVMQLLEEEVFFFTTFGGEALSLAAAKATLAELERLSVPQVLEERGAWLAEEYNRLATQKGLEFTSAVGLPCRTMISFRADQVDPLLAKSFLGQELLRHGVLWSGFHNLSYAHTAAELEHVVKAYDRALDELGKAIAENRLRESILGRPVQPVFRKVNA